MLRFVYIETRDVSMPEDGGPMVSFDSVIFAAESEDTAYDTGHLALCAQQGAYDPDDLATAGHVAGAFLNDYVVAI